MFDCSGLNRTGVNRPLASELHFSFIKRLPNCTSGTRTFLLKKRSTESDFIFLRIKKHLAQDESNFSEHLHFISSLFWINSNHLLHTLIPGVSVPLSRSLNSIHRWFRYLYVGVSVLKIKKQQILTYRGLLGVVVTTVTSQQAVLCFESQLCRPFWVDACGQW